MSVFQNIYLSKYQEEERREEYDRLTVSMRVLLLYTETAISSFKWKNITNVPFFMPEKFLLYSGRIGVFEYEGKAVVYPIYPAGALIDDGEYSAYTAIFPNGKSVRLQREDVVIIFGNSLKLPTYSIVQDFANKSSFALCAVDTALKRAMLPPLIATSSEEQLKKILSIQSPEKLLETICAMASNEGYGEKDLQRVPVFDNRETDVLSLWDVFSRYDRMFYRNFGISTVGIQKNERLTEAESTGEEEMTRYTLFKDMYDCRIAGIEEANKRFGTNIEIEINRDEKTVFEMVQTNEDKIKMREVISSRGSNMNIEEGVKDEKEDDTSNE